MLGTKLHVPATRRPLVARPRLTELVRSGASELPRLVLVSAPAGFGKTTLLSQWLSPTRPGGQAPRVAWLSLDEGDNDLRRLLTHLVGALETSGLEVGAQTTARLESAHELSTETMLTDLVNDVDLMAEETVVALDDYHVIDNAAVHEATSFLLEHLPRHVGLAIATRADPPLPLARLRSRADLVEVRAADLRFTPGESETFFNELMGLDLSPDDILALDARTEGWPAGLQLAALSMRGRDDTSGFIDAFAGSHRFVLDYLVEEVLRRQSDRVADFLMATAVLDQMTGSLCDALTGGDDGAPCSRSSSAATCSSSRSTISAPGTATTTCSRRRSGLDSRASTPAAPSPCTALPASGTPTTACSRTPCITRSPVGRSVERLTSSRRRFPNFGDADATASFVPGSAPCPRARFGSGRC